MTPAAAAQPASTPAVPHDEMIRRMVAWTGLPARQIVGFGDGVAVAVVSGAGSGAHTGVIKDLSLRAEVVDDDTAASLGWRSMRSTVDIDCDHGRDLVRSMEVFADHDLKGPSSSPKLPGGWGQPDRLAYLGGVIAAMCKGGSAAADISPPKRPPSRAAAPVRQAESNRVSPAMTAGRASVEPGPSRLAAGGCQAGANAAPCPPVRGRPGGPDRRRRQRGGRQAGAGEPPGAGSGRAHPQRPDRCLRTASLSTGP